MSNDEKHSLGSSCSVIPTEISTIQMIQSHNLNCDACQAVSVKMITSEDIKSPTLNCKDCGCDSAEYCGNCECKGIPSKMSAQEAIQLLHASCEECKASMLNNEEVHLTTLNFSNEVNSITTVSNQSQSSNYETHVACEGHPTEMSPNEEIYSRSSLCNCQALHAKMLNTEENHFSTPNMLTQALSPKMLSNQSKLPSYQNEIASEKRSKNFSTDVERSSSNETLSKQLLSDSDYTICQNPSPSCKTCIACELSTKMLISEAFPLASLSFIHEALSTKTVSDLSQMFGSEVNNDCEGCSTKMFTDEEVHSRSSSSDALLRNMSTIEDIQIASQSPTSGAIAKKVLCDSNQTIGQSQSSRCETCIGCKISTKKMNNEAFPLASSNFSNEVLSMNTSDQSQSLSGDNRIPNPPTEISTDEESYSRSSVCEALLKKILSYEEIHLVPPSDSGETLSKKNMSEQGQSLNCGPRIHCEGSPHKMSTGGSQSLFCKGISLNKKCDTDSPNEYVFISSTACYIGLTKKSVVHVVDTCVDQG